MLPNASVASPRSAAELAAALPLADCVAFPVSPFVKHIALAPVETPFTPEPARPPKSLAAPAPLYVLKLTLTPPRLVSLGMTVMPGALVRGNFNRLTGAARP